MIKILLRRHGQKQFFNCVPCSFSTNSKLTLPYWDWTQKIEDTAHGLPVLAEDYWKNGPIKGQNGVTVRYPGEYFKEESNIEEVINFYQIYKNLVMKFIVDFIYLL